MDNLIIYSSTDGQTKKICETIKNNFLSNDNIKIISLNETNNINLEKAKKVIIGASIRYGRHSRKVENFVTKNKKILEEKKTAFFSVNVVARKHEKSTPETNPYVIKFLDKTKWRPNKVAVFAGKVDYPNYNFISKNVIRFIMMITKGPTNTANSYEFTNWEMVKKFALELNYYNLFISNLSYRPER